MGIQVLAQLHQHELQRLEFRQRTVDHIGGLVFQMEGKVEAGEEGAVINASCWE